MVDIQHKNITGADAAHPPFYASETDPTTTLGAYRVWFKPSTGEYWVRNAANTAWIDPVTAGAGGGSGGHTIQDEGSNLTARTNLNFTGAGVTVTDDSANDQTDVTIPGGTADPASETVAGIIEIATQAETDAGIDDVRAITPEKLAGRTASETQSGVIEIATQTETNTGTDDARAVTPAKLAGRTSTETRAGVVELATQAETNTGTDDTRAVTPLKLKTNVDLHINDTSDAHDASAISYAGGTGMSATDVEAAVDELATEKANASDLTDHTGDTTDAHDASAISFVPAGSVASTNVQAAIEEVASEAGGGGSAHTIKDEGSALTQRANLNFVGAGVTATDDAGNAETEVTIPGASAASETTAGVLEIATQAETDAGTDDARAVTPAKLANYSGLGGGGSGYRTLVTLGSDVSSNATSFSDLTGLSFSVTSGTVYRFEAYILYTAQATAQGAKFALNGPATTNLVYNNHYWSAANTAQHVQVDAYDGIVANASSPTTGNNLWIIKGIIKPSASGTLTVRIGAEVVGTAPGITAKAGSTLEYW